MLERSPSPRRRARLGAVVQRVLNWPARVAEARRSLGLLGRMSDRELRDIGLLRSDLVDCAALPLDEDPTHKLAQLRAARAWYAPGRFTPRRGLATRVGPESRPGIDDGDERTRLVGADHGDSSLFLMDYHTNIRWTDQ